MNNKRFLKALEKYAKKYGIDQKHILSIINQQANDFGIPCPLIDMIRTGKENNIKIRLDNRMKFELLMRDGRFLKNSSFNKHGSVFYFRNIDGRNYFVEYRIKHNEIRAGFMDDYKDADLEKFRNENPLFDFDDKVMLLDGILVPDFNSEKSPEEIDIVPDGTPFIYEVTAKNTGKKNCMVVLLCPEQNQNHPAIKISTVPDDGIPFGIVKNIKAIAHTDQLNQDLYIADIIYHDQRNPPIALNGTKNMGGHIYAFKLNMMGTITGDDVIVENNLTGGSEFIIGKRFVYFNLQAGRGIRFEFSGDRLIPKR